MTKAKKATKSRRGQSASKERLGSVDRTCENCRWFRPGVERKIKGLFFSRIEKDEATCGYLNGLICSEARVFSVPTRWGRENGFTYVASTKQVEGPCKAKGLFWEPNAELRGRPLADGPA